MIHLTALPVTQNMQRLVTGRLTINELERLRRETVVKFEKVYYPGFAWRN
jgi:hypothetical protein